MSTRCLVEWGEVPFEVYVLKEIHGEKGFVKVDEVHTFDVFHVAQKLVRALQPDDFDSIHFMRGEMPGFWCVTIEKTGDSPEEADRIVREYYIRRG